jgi:hypothetical protein
MGLLDKDRFRHMHSVVYDGLIDRADYQVSRNGMAYAMDVRRSVPDRVQRVLRRLPVQSNLLNKLALTRRDSDDQ